MSRRLPHRREILQASLGGLLACLASPLKTLASDEALAVEHSRETAIQRGLRWLLSQQSADGGWHSETYGALKSGYGITSLVGLLLSGLDEQRRAASESAYQSAIRFLLKAVSSDGQLRLPGEIVDEPVYAAAHLSIALQQRPVADTAQALKLLLQGLQRQQISIGNGWPPDSIGLGGWSTSYTPGFAADVSEPATLSATATILRALACHTAITPAIRDSALEFLSHCQRLTDNVPEDRGGFWFTPDPKHPLNKAGWRTGSDGQPYAIPYATATCDGLLALAACGVDSRDPRVVSGLDFLRRRSPELTAVSPAPENRLPRESAGIPDLERDGLAFYRAAALSRCLRLNRQQLPKTALYLKSLKVLCRRQQPDGAWQNPVKSMREDDPLIATALALLALTE